MVATNLSGVLITSVAGSRPAANAVAGGTVHFSSDTGRISQSDGASTWTTFFTSTVGGFSNPLTTTGDIIYSSSGTTAARLAIGSSANVLTVAGGVPTWAAPASTTALVAAVTRQTTGAEYTTTSGTLADIDATNLSVTLTTGAHRCKVTLQGLMNLDSTSNSGVIDVMIDGTSDTSAVGVWQYRPDGSLGYVSSTFVYVTTSLSAASHTIKLRWKTDGSTLRLNRSVYPLVYLVEELPV